MKLISVTEEEYRELLRKARLFDAMEAVVCSDAYAEARKMEKLRDLLRSAIG